MADRPPRFPPLSQQEMTPAQREVAEAIASGPRTELTTIVFGSAPGSLWCSAASSAAEAITATPCE